jgi:thiamine-phosphate pyrophosphorylase
MSAIERFKASTLYVITCPPAAGPDGYGAMVEAACAGGADIIQFRDKTLSTKERYEVGLQLSDICYAHQVLFIVNDALDLALALGADGVHFGQDDLPQDAAHELVRRAGVKDFLIGRSTHSLEQARGAAAQGADYIGIGPVFATPTKPTYGAVGLDLVRAVTAEVPTPHVAIGGIDPSNAAQVLQAGAKRVAVVRAVCGQADIAEACRAMKRTLTTASAAPA